MTAGKWSGNFNFNIKLVSDNSIGDLLRKAPIKAIATNSESKNFNVNAYEINDEKKDELLNKLSESDFIENKDDVAALIEVKSDYFDDIARTTFDEKPPAYL